MKIDRTKNTIRNMWWGYVYRVIGLILPFILRTVIIYNLGAEYLGINSLFTSILQVLNLSELGFSSAIVYNMYGPIVENDHKSICALLNYYRRVYFIIGCIIMGVGTMIVPAIPYLISGSYPENINIYFVYLMFLINTSISYFLFAYKGSLLNAFQRNDIESKILIVVALIRYSVEMVGIVITRDYYLFLFVEIFSTILQNLLKYLYTKRLFPDYKCSGKITSEQKNSIRKNVIALMCHKIGGVVLNAGDNIVISAFMGVIMVSNYGNYYYIMNAVESLIIICFTGMTAGIGNSFIVETKEKNRENFKCVLFFNAWIVAVSAIILLCLYQDFMKLWVGQEYMFSNGIVVLIVMYFFAHSIRRTILTFRDGAGMWQDNKWQPIVSASFNIIVNVILVQFIGLYGIVLSSILSMVIIDIPWETKLFCKQIEMNSLDYIVRIIAYFIITCLVAGGTYFITSFVNLSIVWNLIVKAIICLVAPNLVFWTIGHRLDEYQFFKKLIWRYISVLDKRNYK